MTRTTSLLTLSLTFIFTSILTYLSIEGSDLELTGTLANIVILILAITEGIKIKFNLSGVLWFNVKASQIISFLVGFGLGTISYFLELGYFLIISTWYYSGLIGMVMALVANGLVTYDVVISVLSGIKNWLSK